MQTIETGLFIFMTKNCQICHHKFEDNTKNHLGKYCLKCRIIIHKKQNDEEYLRHREVRLKQRAEWRKIHRQELNQKAKLYRQTDRYRDLHNKNFAVRRLNDINFKLLENLRNRLNRALKCNYKHSSVVELLCCSIEQLRNYLENKFKPGMSWSNYGQWHVDHIIPCASFNLNNADEQLKCFNYSNLQPLWAEENLSKNDKILI